MANGEPEVLRQAARLRADGARLLVGMISDTGGVLRAKSVPAARIESFATNGMGASPSWAVFCVDNHVAFTPEIGVVGDVRLVADLAAARVLDDGFAVAPPMSAPRTASGPGCAGGMSPAAPRGSWPTVASRCWPGTRWSSS